MIELDVGDDDGRGTENVGGVPSTEHADFDHGNVDAGLGEPQQTGDGDRLEPTRGDAELEGGGSDRLEQAVEFIIGGGFAVDADPLATADEMWAGVQADVQARGTQQCAGDGARRALAVGARDVYRRVAALRVSQRVEQLLGVAGRWIPDRAVGLVADEQVEVVQA